MSKPAGLIELCPEDSEFTLSDGRTYRVRRFTLNDQAWVQKTFGSESALTEAFKDPESLMRIVFHQLPVDQQKEFSPIEVELVDEETGEARSEKVGGWRRFAQSIPNASKDLTEVAKALTAAMVGSAALADGEEAQAPKKKNLRTGAQSSTSSPQSTATASS